MGKKSNTIKSLLIIFALVLLITPYFQGRFKIINLPPLSGAITLPENNYINTKDWFSGEYQIKKEEYLNETFGFRNFFLRLNNQIIFSLFNKARANGVVVGKENYLFEENYIKAYYGTDFVGRDSILHQVQRMKFIQDTLSKLDKNLILVFAAGKGSFYPEYFPEKYKTKKKTTNYEIYLNEVRDAGIRYIDFNSYFLANKNISRYPLYPQYGIHWSYYGTCLAADSIIRYIEKIRKIDMPNLYWEEIELSQPRETDYDIGEGMNILFRLRSFDMAYPGIHIQSDTGKTRPSVLVVSDSYYWEMFNFGITRAFENSKFWFYNKEIYPDSYQSPKETDQIDLKQEIEQHDVFIIMGTEATLSRFGWGFITNLYEHFKGKEREDIFDVEFKQKLTNLRNYIKSDKNWMEHIEEKARKNKISVDSMLTLDAIWELKQPVHK